MSIPVARLGDTQVSLHITFLAAAGVLAACGFGLHLVIFATSLLFHELGHMIAASLQGAEMSAVEMWPFGAVGRIERPWQLTPFAETAVALAGPLNSGLLCSLSLAAERALMSLQGPLAPSEFPLLDLCMRVNLGLVLVNLIPCLPLDGGRALRAQMSLRWGYLEASRRASQWGLWAGIAMTVVAALGTLAGRGWYPFLIVGPLIAWGATEERENAASINIASLLSRSEYLVKKKAIPVEEIMVSPDATVGEVVQRFRPSRYHVVLVAGRGMKVAGRLTEGAILEAFCAGRTTMRVKDLLKAGPSP